jgi:cell division protein FtsB
MMHRDGDLTSRSLRLPLWLVRTGVITGSVLVVLIVVGAILYTPIARTAARVPAQNREIERLRAENEQVHQLAATLEEVEARYDQMRAIMGADVVRARAGSRTRASTSQLRWERPSVRRAVGSCCRQGRIRSTACSCCSGIPMVIRACTDTRRGSWWLRTTPLLRGR